MSLTRRGFIQTGAGLVIGLYIAPKNVLAQQAPPAPKAPDPNAFLRIGVNDSVTVLLAHSEMGQGIWTTLPMLIAEELGCDWSKIRVEHAPAGPAYAHPVFGIQMTGGSASSYGEFDRYRQVGAMAREMLLAAAAAEWKVSPDALHVDNGFVVRGGRKISFGKLAEAAQKLAPPAKVSLKAAKDWKILGKPTKRLDSPEKVSGKALFGMDIQLPGMLTAVVARGPGFGAKVKALRPAKAGAVAGVKKVVQVPSGVAVIAEHFWAAKLGRDALEIDWDAGPGGALDSEKLRQELRDLCGKPGTKAASAGDVEAGMQGAAKTVEAEYELPYLAHAPMEPLNCTVHITSEGVEVWAGTQFQTMDQMAAAKIAGFTPDKVKIHTLFLGGGFGRRATPTSDFVTEAVHVAKASGLGVPIKVVWTREDDIRGGYYRAMWHHRIRAGLDKDGSPSTWRHTMAGQSIATGTVVEPMMVHDGVDSTSVEGAAGSPYLKKVPNHLVDLHSPKTPVPVLWWRSVGNTHTAFAMESFIDELAAAAGQDPLAYRRRLLAGERRHLGALELAASKAGWGKKLPKGHFQGLAVHFSFESFAAEVAEVSVDDGKIRVHKVTCAIDCGIAMNPTGITAQVESAIVYALTAALYGEISFRDGVVQQSNFHDYKLLRLNEMPEVAVHIVPSTEKPGGVGEVGVPPLAPAVANALFAATGKRMRKLPFQLA